MCGISAFFVRDGSPNNSAIRELIRYGFQRGSDGFGWCIVNSESSRYKKYVGVPDIDTVFYDMGNPLEIGDVFLSIARAAPETECSVSSDKLDSTVQPIIDQPNGLYLIHNGAIAGQIIEDLKNKGCQFNSEIDSEAILRAYLYFQKNVPKMLHYLSGGFAFILYDAKLNRLIISTNHQPLFCGYVKGFGFFLSSIEEAIWKTIQDLKGLDVRKNGIFLWEDYYGHEVKSFTYQIIDLQNIFPIV